MIYLDTSAALKLIVPEPHSAALADWLAAHATEVIMSSALLRVETHRALRRITAQQPAHDLARTLLDGLHLRPVDAALHRAATLNGQHMRSLDAIHLAAALDSDTPPTFVTYDTRLAERAAEAGIATAAPDDNSSTPA